MTATGAEHELLMEEQFERAKAYLMSANKDGISVYDQLTRLMEHLLSSGSEDALQDPTRFAELFALVQKYSFVRGESTAPCNEPATTAPAMLQRLQENKRLFERPTPEVRTTIEQPDPYTTVTTTTIKPLTAPSYPSVTEQNRFWAAAGCGMAEEEAFLLDHSITKLAMEKNLQDVRFVGKLFGLQGNYYVISSRRYLRDGEVVYQEVNTMPKPPRKKVDVPVQPEPGFVGCNSLSFWVTSYPSAPWVLLPDVTPQQIDAARRIKRLLTGDLEAEVIGSPTFAWSEAVYLRAQLSRIISATFICPQGALQEPDEDDARNDDEDEDENEDDEGRVRKPKEARYRPTTLPVREFAEEEMDMVQLASTAQWVHAEREILKSGRQTKVPAKPVTSDEDEDDTANAEEQMADVEDEDEEADEAQDAQDDDLEDEDEEEQEKELFLPIQGDHLYAVLDVPQPPPVEMEEEEEDDEETEAEAGEETKTEAQRLAAEAAAAAEAAKAATVANNPAKPVHDEDIAAEDATKLKVPAWGARLAHNTDKAHRVAVVHSLRWPGAIAYAAEGGRRWGCVYFGTGLKKVHPAFTPILAPPILGECADIVEVMDPTAATEKLVRRGEEVPEQDSEDEPGDEEMEENEEM